MTGLTAALALAEAGRSVLVVDKGRGVGGRMATRRIGVATLDHGAQFFTVRSEEFRRAVEWWAADGIVSVWTNGFGDHPDGHPRYRAAGGMAGLAKHLASAARRAGAEIVMNQRVDSLIDTGDAIAATYAAGSRPPDEAAAAVLTSPVPQSIDMLESGGSPVPEAARAISYDPVIALLAVTDGGIDGRLGPAGARQLSSDPTFTFVADNRTKGISDRSAVTFHVDPGLSSSMWQLPDVEIRSRLEPEIGRFLGPVGVREFQVKKWRYAAPRQIHPDRYIDVRGCSRPVLLAGDAFGGAKVEGAFLSGRASAAALVTG